MPLISSVRRHTRQGPQAGHGRRGTVRVPETIPPTLRRGAAWRSGALRGFVTSAKTRRFVQQQSHLSCRFVQISTFLTCLFVQTCAKLWKTARL